MLCEYLQLLIKISSIWKNPWNRQFIITLMFIIAFVESKTAFLFKTLGTNFTSKLLEIRVTTHVICHTLFASKCSVALGTLVRFFAGVNTFMLLQVILTREALVTVLAHVRSVSSVGLQVKIIQRLEKIYIMLATIHKLCTRYFHVYFMTNTKFSSDQSILQSKFK